MRKLAGTDVIVLIKTALKDEVVLKEASALSRNDFAKDDLIMYECVHLGVLNLIMLGSFDSS